MKLQFALAIQSLDELAYLHQPWSDFDDTAIEEETQADVQAVFSEKVNSSKVDRIYFGSEFCQYRLPKPEAVRQAYQHAKELGVAFTLVTPYLPPRGFHQVEEMLSILDQSLSVEEKEQLEIVVNDWGMLHYLHHNYEEYPLIVGRLLNKMIRDPRVMPLVATSQDAPSAAQQALRQSAQQVDYVQQFLLEQGVTRLEVDNMLQGWQEIEAFPFPLSLHVGFGCVATGRTCLVGTLHQPKANKFKGDVVCKQQCRHYQAELISQKEALGSLSTRLIQKGNTVFYQQDREVLKQGLEWASGQEDVRIVYSPRLPV